MLKNHNKNDPKADFYSFSSNFNWLVKITPLFILKYIHSLLFKYDPIIYKVEKKIDSITSIYYNIRYPFANFYDTHFCRIFRRLKSALSYARYGYYTNEWDFSSIFDLLVFKLNRLERSIRNGHLLNSDLYADQIKIVKELLGMVNDDSNYYIFDELESKYPKFKSSLFQDLDNEVRHIYLTDSGAKRVLFETIDANHNKLTTEEKELKSKEISRLSRYYSELKVANLRVAFHILTPSFGEYYNKIKIKNEEIREKEGITHENYYDNLDKLKYTHSGVFSWWE